MPSTPTCRFCGGVNEHVDGCQFSGRTRPETTEVAQLPYSKPPVKHTCHHPRCNEAVPPKMLSCKAHWFELPKDLRSKVWDAYTPRQEVTKNPKAEYAEVIREVMEYWNRDEGAAQQEST